MKAPRDPDELKNQASPLAMPLLVERLGETVELTEAELKAFAERHGGIKRVGVKMERTQGGASGGRSSMSSGHGQTRPPAKLVRGDMPQRPAAAIRDQAGPPLSGR